MNALLNVEFIRAARAYGQVFPSKSLDSGPLPCMGTAPALKSITHVFKRKAA